MKFLLSLPVECTTMDFSVGKKERDWSACLAWVGCT